MKIVLGFYLVSAILSYLFAVILNLLHNVISTFSSSLGSPLLLSLMVLIKYLKGHPMERQEISDPEF